LGFPKFLRRTFQEWAVHSIAYSPWAENIANINGPKRKRRKTAMRPLASKWIGILFTCWKERKPYNEAIYRRALGACPPEETACRSSCGASVENVASFRKIAIAETLTRSRRWPLQAFAHC
jgi:hypothetical protein